MKIKTFKMITEEGVAEYTARLSAHDFRQGRSHSGCPKFTAWEKSKHKCALRAKRHHARPCIPSAEQVKDIHTSLDEYNSEVHSDFSAWQGNRNASVKIPQAKLINVLSDMIAEKEYSSIAGENLISGIIFDASMGRAYRRRGDTIIYI